MKHVLSALLLVIALSLTGCAAIFGPPLQAGDPEHTVIAKRGTPTARYKDGDSTLLEFAGGYWGQYTDMARLGPDGRLVSYEQVLTTEKFASLIIGKSTKQEVLFTVGQPFETDFMPLAQQEVWSYRYKQDGLWNSLMHISFDKNGIVRKMENTVDTMLDGEAD